MNYNISYLPFLFLVLSLSFSFSCRVVKAVSSFANGMPCKIDCKTGNLMEKLKASKKMCDNAYESKYDFDEELGDRITSPLMVWLDK